MIRVLALVILIIALSTAETVSDAPEREGVENISDEVFTPEELEAFEDTPKTDDVNNVAVQFLTPQELEEHLAANPDVVLTPLEVVADRATRRYIIGARARGDRMVVNTSGKHSWPSARKVDLALRYPPSGAGRIVTFIDITVWQSNNLGHAFISRGGIRSRFVTVVIVANRTTYLNYLLRIYGL